MNWLISVTCAGRKKRPVGRLRANDRRALKRFQRDNNLPPDGTLHEATQLAIRQLNDGVRRGSRGDVVRDCRRASWRSDT